jgi:hypothetical protein
LITIVHYLLQIKYEFERISELNVQELLREKLKAYAVIVDQEEGSLMSEGEHLIRIVN